MPRYLLHHHHEAERVRRRLRRLRGFESPLRHKCALASCGSGGHSIWWTVDAASEENALALLPFYVAERTTAVSGQRGADPVTGARSRNQDGGAMSTSCPNHTWSELALRENDGLAVSLLWNRATGRVKVAVADAQLDEQFEFDVPARTRSRPSTTRSPTRRGSAPPSATPPRVRAPERSTV